MIQSRLLHWTLWALSKISYGLTQRLMTFDVAHLYTSLFCVAEGHSVIFAISSMVRDVYSDRPWLATFIICVFELRMAYALVEVEKADEPSGPRRAKNQSKGLATGLSCASTEQTVS